MTERLWVQTPTKDTIYQAPFIWMKSIEAKIEWKLNLHCCRCCNPVKIEKLKTVAYKIQLDKDEMRAGQLTRTKSYKKAGSFYVLTNKFF